MAKASYAERWLAFPRDRQIAIADNADNADALTALATAAQGGTLSARDKELALWRLRGIVTAYDMAVRRVEDLRHTRDLRMVEALICGHMQTSIAGAAGVSPMVVAWAADTARKPRDSAKDSQRSQVEHPPAVRKRRRPRADSPVGGDQNGATPQPGDEVDNPADNVVLGA